MNKHFKSHLLLALLSVGLATTPQATAARWGFHAHTNDDDILWGLGIAAGITAVGCGIAAACNVFSWSDEDILTWVKDGINECDAKYQQLNHYNGPTISNLQLFGNRNKATWSICSTEADEVTYDNPHFAPLHNTLLIIKGDIKNLLEYNSYLVSRNLTQTQRGRAYYQKIAAIIANLEFFKDAILSSSDYTHEEHVLQPKIHQLRQERLARERNAALREQARAQYDQAQAIREQTEAQWDQARRDSYNERERNRIRREQEQLRDEQERIQREQDRLRREQDLQRSNSRDQERIRKEQDRLRKEQEKLRREQERLQRIQEQQAREQQNSAGPASCDITMYNDHFPVLLDY